jgi:putative transposase
MNPAPPVTRTRFTASFLGSGLALQHRLDGAARFVPRVCQSVPEEAKGARRSLAWRDMARPLRVCPPGAVVHVIVRGNEQGPIVQDDHDRHTFLAILARAVERYQWLCHTYCLMDNHYHLLLEVPLGNLPLGMRQLNGVYAQSYNRRHQRFGHLFQARYRSILVEKNAYLLSVCRYIVLNPVRAGVVQRPEDYAWSSHRAMAGLDQPPGFLATEWVLSQFAPTRRLAQARYRAFVAAGLEKPTVSGERVGSEEFLSLRLGRHDALPEVPRAQLQPLRRPLADVFANEQTPIAIAYRAHDYRLHEIAAHLGCHYSTVSRALAREEAMLQRKT